MQHWTRSWNGEREVWVPIRPSDTDPLIGGDSLGRALSQPGGAAGYGGGTRFESWNSGAPSASVDSGTVVVPREYIQSPLTGGPTVGVVTGGAIVVSEVDRERARAARERRVRLNAVYDVVPDVIASINAANAGDFVQGVALMRRAALQNPDALVGERTPLDLLIERDPGFAQRVRWSLAAYQNPPSGTVGDADALFMVAALSAALNQHEVARASVEAAIVREPDRVSTQGLRQALRDQVLVDEAQGGQPGVEWAPTR